ncbi:MAG: NAD(P)-binding protein, partial [Candidatus Hodgkinia cicadicola]
MSARNRRPGLREQLVVLGSGPAGLSAAICAARYPQLSPLVITGPHFGGALATEAPIEPWPSVGPN